jgi:hypothetical protein
MSKPPSDPFTQLSDLMNPERVLVRLLPSLIAAVERLAAAAERFAPPNGGNHDQAR